MNVLIHIVFALLVACTTAGIVTGLVSGGNEQLTDERTDIMVVPGKGAFALQMVPLDDSMGAFQAYVQLLWRNENMEYFPLQVVQVTWPLGNILNIETAKTLIKPKGIDANNQLTVHFLKDEVCVEKTFNWQSNTYVPGSETTMSISEC